MQDDYDELDFEYDSRGEKFMYNTAYRREVLHRGILLALLGFSVAAGTIAFSGEAGGYEEPEYRELEEEDTQEAVEEFFPEESNKADEFGF